MSLGTFQAPIPVNEPLYNYAPGSPEREQLKSELDRQATEVHEIVPRMDGLPIPP